MDVKDVIPVRDTPEFKALIRARRRLNTPIVLTIILAYFGFVLLIAFDPLLLGHPIGGGPISVGIAAGFALLILTFLLTVIYLHFAGSILTPLQDRIREKYGVLAVPK